MINDMRTPQKNPQKVPLGANRSAPQKQPGPVLPPIDLSSEPVSPPQLQKHKKKSLKKILLITLGGLAALIVALVAAAFIWYKQALLPVDPGNQESVRITIETGSSPSQIAETLKGNGLIRDPLAFDIYNRLSGTRSKLQAGTYHFSPSNSVEEIVTHLVSGLTEQFSVTFYPGATLTDSSKKAIEEKTDVYTVLQRAGYSDTEITAAFSATYTNPMFASKPKNATLEGYVYGDTYNFEADATAQEILQRAFDELQSVITENNMEDSFKKHGLNLFEAITLASIVQRESAEPDVQKQIAQVFYTRLQKNMPLGADPTYQYAAQILGVAPTPELDSPYNTRKYEGLPPGPISNPGLTALQAVASPASGDYLYFVSGDDDKTYFSHTEEQHQQNVDAYCQIKCATY